MPRPPDYEELPEIDSPEMFARTLDDSICWIQDEVRRRRNGASGNGSLRQLSALLSHLWLIRDHVVARRLPSLEERESRSPLWILTNEWDPWDHNGERIAGVILFYLKTDRIADKFPDASLNDQLVSARSLASELVRHFQAEDLAKLTCPPTEHPDVLTMPHNPDKRSVDVARDYAREEVVKRAEQIATAREQRNARFFWDLCSQWLIVGLTDYWYKRPLNEVARSLRQGLGFAGEAITFGYPVHAWDIFFTFLKAEALADQRLAGQIMALAEEAWNRNQIKPVHWLVLQVRCCFALHRDDDRALDPLLADLHHAIFTEALPSELTRDLPLMHNFWYLLRALRLHDGQDFNQRLAERAELLSTSYRQGGGIAPIALCDLHALGLCRFAKQRALPLTANHVYLPFGLLDEMS